MKYTKAFGMKQCLWALAIAVWCAAGCRAVDWKSYPKHGCVNDFAGVMDPGTKSQLETYCSAVDRATGVQIVLASIPSVEGEPLRDVAESIFQNWHESAKAPSRFGEPDRRVMLLLVPGDRRQWIVAGSGIQNPALSNRVLREIRPALRRLDYNEAFRAAADTIGEAAAASAHVRLAAHLPRTLRWTMLESISWPAVIGACVIVTVLFWFGAPAGYGGFAARGMIPLLIRRHAMRRSTWGSRGNGGFGGYDSGDATAGLGGAACNDW